MWSPWQRARECPALQFKLQRAASRGAAPCSSLGGCSKPPKAPPKGFGCSCQLRLGLRAQPGGFTAGERGGIVLCSFQLEFSPCSHLWWGSGAVGRGRAGVVTPVPPVPSSATPGRDMGVPVEDGLWELLCLLLGQILVRNPRGRTPQCDRPVRGHRKGKLRHLRLAQRALGLHPSSGWHIQAPAAAGLCSSPCLVRRDLQLPREQLQRWLRRPRMRGWH